MPSTTPDIPGNLLHEQDCTFLRQTVQDLTGSHSTKFPGSQPVSFSTSSFNQLETRNFWVCEKSDGVRVLVLILFNNASQTQDVFLLDRKDTYRQVSGLFFPHHETRAPLGNTILDGELVWDVEKKTGKRTLRLYAFDCLVYHGQNLMQSGLESRFGRLKRWVVAPFHQYRSTNRVPPQPFDLVCKEMQLAYVMDVVIRDIIPKLEHGHDGLIFTCAESGYVMGTDENIIKWKPPEENSVDFTLRLRFPPLGEADSDPGEPDWTARPFFGLYQWAGGREEEFFDEMEVGEDEWEEWKAKGEQYDDRVVECNVNLETGGWRFMRFRDDKEHGNHKSIVEKIIKSITDGVKLDELLARAPTIRAAWKERKALAEVKQQQQQQPAPPPSRQSSNNPYAAGGSQFPVTPNGGAGLQNYFPPAPAAPPGFRR